MEVTKTCQQQRLACCDEPCFPYVVVLIRRNSFQQQSALANVGDDFAQFRLAIEYEAVIRPRTLGTEDQKGEEPDININQNVVLKDFNLVPS